ncbi:MAG: hypothetical protein L0H19_04220, partial [Salinisphaera sp.]|nr:hypothetical protein [Salinisphaera sp.]
PKTYPLFAKRPPNDHGYYEAFNRDNVQLVDIANREPLETVTATGIRTSGGEYEFDLVVLATGFDAVTGALENVDIRGRGGLSLKDKWHERLRTLFGVGCHDFPNLFMINGPQSPFANIPTMIESNIAWIRDCIAHMQEHGYARAEATAAAEDAWAVHTNEVIEYTVARQGAKGNAWFMGANIAGRQPQPLVYFGGGDAYMQQLNQSRQNGFEGVTFAADEAAPGARQGRTAHAP